MRWKGKVAPCLGSGHRAVTERLAKFESKAVRG